MTDWPRVAFVAGTLGPGGAERQLYEHCQILATVGARPVVLSLTQGEEWEPRLMALGIRPIWVGQSPNRPARLHAVTRALRQHRVDVIQASHGMTNLYAVGAGRILRRPNIGALRTAPEQVVNDLGRLGLLALRAPQRLVGNSRANLDAAVQLGVRPDRIRYLPNAVDLDRFVPRSQSVPPGGTGGSTSEGTGGRIDVVFVGRLGPEKRVDVLIEAVALLRGRGREVTASIVGAGSLDVDLRRQVQRLGLDAQVTFIGGDPAPERWFREARLLVLPSAWEGTPNVVLEAMACGLPVIATPVGSLPDLVDDGQTGRLVPVGDPGALALALLELLDDPRRAERMGAAGRRRVEAEFDAAAVREAMGGIYRDLGQGRWPCAG